MYKQHTATKRRLSSVYALILALKKAAAAILSDLPAPWIGPTQRARLKGILRRLTGIGLVSRARDRAEVHRYEGHSRAAERLRQELVDTSSAAAVLGLVEAPDRVDGYVGARNLDKIVARHALIDGRR